MKRLNQITAVATLFLAIGCGKSALAQDQFHTFFDGAVAGVGNLGGFTFDAAGNFWVIGRDNSLSSAIRKINASGPNWTGETYVPNTDWAFFYRSDNPSTGITHPQWGGPQFGTPSGILLNPAPLTITIPTGTGGTVSKTYQPGELAFMSDQQGSIGPSGGDARPDATKRLTRYDLRKIDAPTTVKPDFNNASNGDGSGPTTVFGAFGKADWNDVLTQVISEDNVAVAAGIPGGSSNWGRQFKWSSDGQKIYIVDIAANTGGIYRVDATTTGSLTRIWTDSAFNSEPAIVPTTLRDFLPGNPAVGDQIVIDGSTIGGNEGGINVFTDPGTGNLSAPTVLLTESQFRDFAEYTGTSSPVYNHLTSDASGNLYFYEQQTDGLFKYDLQGRLVKVSSEAELNKFQTANGATSLANDLLLRIQARTSMGPGFSVTELVYADDAIDTPVGIYDFKAGDFDRNNLVNSADLSLFSAALGLRGELAADADLKFDLNGNALTTNGNTVVDWKDVKIFQQFVNIPNGDTNFDSLLNFTDLDVLAANYFTLPGQNLETWATGDITSIEAGYPATALDANRVDTTDLLLFADAWLNDLLQPTVTDAQLIARGYSLGFRTDVLAAFDAAAGVEGDYNGNGVVDAADYTVWRDSLGRTGSGLAADGNGDLVVNTTDYAIWKTNFGSAAGSASGLASASAVPEPTGFALLLTMAVACFPGLVRGCRK